MRTICKFRDMPYISPYSDFSRLRPGTPEKEKHACGIVHEILSLTVEKRTLVDHLTHFREEFRFSQQLRGLLIRHLDMFYVSLKGDRDSVFLREAYRDSQLIEKDRLLLIKEKFRSLVAVPQFSRRNAPACRSDGDRSEEDDGQEDVSGTENEEDWDDIEDILNRDDGLEDGDEGNDDDSWGDEDDDTPPDFCEDNDNVKIHIIDEQARAYFPGWSAEGKMVGVITRPTRERFLECSSCKVRQDLKWSSQESRYRTINLSCPLCEGYNLVDYCDYLMPQRTST